MEQNYDQLVKLLLIGESGVGKTCLIQKYIKDEYMIHHLPTIAIDFKMKYQEVNGKKLKMQIWDTAGQERFNTLTKGFFKASHGVILVYSITDERSFLQVNKWLNFINENAPKEVKVLLVGNKSDLQNERQVTQDAGEECAKRNNIDFMETSAFDGTNVERAFVHLGSTILKDYDSIVNSQTPFHLKKKKQKKCC